MHTAVILNLSGHRVPTDVFDNLKERGYEHFTIFSEIVHLDVDNDYGTQCKEILHSLLTKTNSHGRTACECDGDVFMLLPGHSTAAVLLYQALEKLMGYPVPLLITGIDTSGPRQSVRYKMIGDPFYVKGYAGQWRNAGRKKYMLGNGVQEVSASSATAVRPKPRARQRTGDSNTTYAQATNS